MFVSLRWSTDIIIDRTLAERDQGFEAPVLKAGVWFGVKPSCSIKSTIHVMQENFSVSLY